MSLQPQTDYSKIIKHESLGEETTMEVITFTKDTVLSDIHVYIPHKRHLMVRLNKAGQPVFQTHFSILWKNSASESSRKDSITISDDEDPEIHQKAGLSLLKTTKIPAIENLLDEDGDLEVQRRPQYLSDRDDSKHYARNVVCPTIVTISSEGQIEEEECVNNKDVITIEHTMATPLEDVGKQIWRGAFLLADYILSHQDLFRGCTALELGAGTGFTSIVMATVAKTVFCTDVGEDLLEMCERNVVLNQSFLEQAGGGEVKVKEMDWCKNQFCTDEENPYNWTEDDIAHFYNYTSVILAADVFYDDDLTDALFKTLSRITHALRSNCVIYLSIERRYNFTLRYMDVTCDAYNHFRKCLKNFETTTNGKQKWSLEEIKPVFTQYFVYEREHLELWKLIATPLT